MGKHLFVRDNKIINRVALQFKLNEMTCKDICYEDRGVDGIDLSDVSKDCFNIFCLRCKEALANFPDDKWMVYEHMREAMAMKEGKPFPKGSHVYHSIINEWKEILKRLELDKRFDAAWIEDYERKCNVAVAPAVPANKTD